MRKKDKTEKALENYNDVFADIVNALVPCPSCPYR